MIDFSQLETYSYYLMAQSEPMLGLISIGVMVAGFILGLLIWRHVQFELHRMPYFVLSSAAYLLLAALPLIWLAGFEAIKRELLWVLVAAIAGVLLAFGAASAWMARARSVSAYGDGRRAWWALIPIVNLLLAFSRPANARPGGFGQSIFNFVGVMIGCVVLALGLVMERLVEEQIDMLALEVEFNEGMQAASVEMLVKGVGLEEALRQIAHETPGAALDEVTVLMGVRSEGNVLRYFYRIDTDAERLTDQERLDIAREMCDYAPMLPLLQAGGEIEDVYERPDQSELGRVRVTRTSCTF